MRIRSSSSDRKNFDAGVALTAGRPRSWLSMRRLSWRSVPRTNSPPAPSAFSFSRATSARSRPRARSRSARAVLESVELLADAHVGVAAELDVGAAAGHVGGDGDRARHAGLGDDVGFLLVVAGVQDGEHLGLGGAVVAAVSAANALGSEKSSCSQPSWRSSSASCSDFSIDVVPTSTGWPRALQSSISVMIAWYFSAAVR